MVRNLSTTKMEMYIDEDYWITKRFSERACDIKDTPEDMGFLSLLLHNKCKSYVLNPNRLA